MDVLWSRLLKSVYHKEPIVGFVATVGVVDAAIGQLSGHWSLLSFGLGTVSVAIALRLWQLQRHRPVEPAKRASVHVLPPSSSRPSLPNLSISKKNPPRRS
jgi:protein-S-isoprenylcysteine O-methyltransferase Ste14